MQHPYYQRTSMSAPPRYLQPSVAPPGHHIRRQPRPRSVHLETLPERDVEETSGSELENGMTNDIVGGNYSTRPTNMSHSNIPPYDNPTYHSRAATTPAYSPYARPHSRRLSSYPHRSSPLAGPSLALTQDGTLTNVTVAQRPRSLLSVCESAYNSPSPSANPSLENLTINTSAPETKENIPTPPPTPPAQAKQTPSRRLSLGLKKLTSLPSLPKRISASIPAPPSHSYSTNANSHSSSKGKAKEESTTAAEAAAPVPHVPVWASPGHVPARTGSRAPMPFRPHSPNAHLHPNSAMLNRRASQVSLTPSVASVQSVQSSKSSHRRSMAVSANPVPSTSRDPELNWLSTAAPPKFSRLSLKAEGVVMPVSAKEMRRRSTVSMSRTSSVRSIASVNSSVSTMSRISENGRPMTDMKRSLTEDLSTLRKLEGNTSTPTIRAPPSRPTTPVASALSSLSEEDISDSDIVSPPYPPFFHNSSKNSSASSITTASGEESDIPETPSLSRTSSVTEDGESEGGLPRTPPSTIASEGSVGIISEATKDLHIRGGAAVAGESAKASVPVVKTAEAVTVKVVGVRGSVGHKKEGRSLDASVKVERRGTLKKVWGRMFGGRSASMPALKV
ncbi:hypothetical protein BC629DRAFT_258610 [Irpex lacteus]|nr:hypothetical protein BC629DRAFT_258610 [Irpex lacteus]